MGENCRCSIGNCLRQFSTFIRYFKTMLKSPPETEVLHYLNNIQKLHGRSVWTLIGGETLEVASFGAKFFALCWAFVALVVIEK